AAQLHQERGAEVTLKSTLTHRLPVHVRIDDLLRGCMSGVNRYKYFRTRFLSLFLRLYGSRTAGLLIYRGIQLMFFRTNGWDTWWDTLWAGRWDGLWDTRWDTF